MSTALVMSKACCAGRRPSSSPCTPLSLDGLRLDGRDPRESPLECPICLSPFEAEGDRVPHVLGCAHTVCKQCIGLLPVHPGEPHPRCPTCQAPILQPPLPNYALRDAVAKRPTDELPPRWCEECESARASVFCEQCQVGLCAGCMSATHNSKVLKRHRTRQIGGSGGGRCAVHAGSTRSQFCVDCDQPICPECARADHAGHSVQSLTEAAASCRERIYQAIVTAVAAEAEAIERSRSLERVVAELGEERAGCCSEDTGTIGLARRTVSETFGRLRAELDGREAALDKMLQAAGRDKVEQVNSQLHQLGIFRSRLFSSILKAEAVSQCRPEELLAVHREVLSQLEQAIQAEVTDTPLPDPTAGLELSIEHVLEQIRELGSVEGTQGLLEDAAA